MTNDGSYIPGSDPALEARGKSALRNYLDAISGRPQQPGVAAIDQWQAQLKAQADLPVPPVVGQSYLDAISGRPQQPGVAAIDQWQAQLKAQADLPVPPVVGDDRG
jgi:hypothetical protein